MDFSKPRRFSRPLFADGLDGSADFIVIPVKHPCAYDDGVRHKLTLVVCIVEYTTAGDDKVVRELFGTWSINFVGRHQDCCFTSAELEVIARMYEALPKVYNDGDEEVKVFDANKKIEMISKSKST